MQPLSRRGALALLGAAAASTSSRAIAGFGLAKAPSANGSIILDMQSGFDSDRIGDAPADLRRSGLTALSMTVGQVGNGLRRFESTVADVALADGWCDRYRSSLLPVRRFADLGLAKASGRTGLIFNVQDTAALDGDVARVAVLKGLGIRVVQLTYNKRNLCGDGCLEPGNAGLSDFGREVIGAINEQRLLLDLSHAGQKTISDAARFSKVPIAISHTGCRSLVNNPRNIYDDQMREVAARGGVIGIYFVAYLRSGIGQVAADATRDNLIAHLEHAIQICGEDHVGIGTDGNVSKLEITPAFRAFWKERYADRVRQGVATPGEGSDVFNYIPDYAAPDRLLRLAEDLRSRGWPSRRVEKLLGGNFYRLLSDVWDA